MIRKLLLLGLMLGVAAVAGANEAGAVAVLDPAPPVAQTVPDPQFASVDFKRRSLHRGFGGVRKSFRGSRSFAGKRFRPGGVSVKKRFVSPRLFLGKRFGDAGVVVRKGFVGPRLFLGKRFGDSGVVVRRGFAGQRLFPGKRFKDSGVVVRKGFGGKRFGHRRFFCKRGRSPGGDCIFGLGVARWL